MANAWVLKPLPMTATGGAGAAAATPVSNLANDYMGVVWRTTSVTGPTIIFDLGADVAVDTIMLFGISGFPSGTTFQVSLATQAQGNGWGGGHWSSGFQTLLAGTEMPASGFGSMLWSAPSVSGPPAAIRYINIQFSYTPASIVQAARLVVGKRIALARNFSFGAALGVRDFGSLDFSNRAVLLRRYAKKLRSVGLTFASAYKDEVEAQIMPLLEEIGGTDCIALITDPAADAMRQRRMYYGPLVGEIGTIWRNAAAWQWQATLQSLI